MIKIPLTLLDLHGDGFHLLMEVVVFGQKFQAVLDTGASKTVFDQEILQQSLDIALEPSDRLSTGLGTNTMKSYSYVIPELILGIDGLSIYNLDIAVLDLSTINFAYREMQLGPVIGVIGGDILHTYEAVIRYKEPSLSLRHKPRVKSNAVSV